MVIIFREDWENLWCIPEENWKVAEEYSDRKGDGSYLSRIVEASDLGRVRATWTTNTGAVRKRILHQFRNMDGYCIVKIHRQQVRVHRVVLSAFVKERGAGQVQVDHINRDRADNRLCNLRWVSNTENNTFDETLRKRNQSLLSNVEMYDYINGRTVKVWRRLTHACKELGIPRYNLNNAFGNKEFFNDSEYQGCYLRWVAI